MRTKVDESMGINYDDQRNVLVDYLIKCRRLRSPQVIDAMRNTPRHLFIPKTYRPAAYQDRPLDIGEGQTISAPHMVAIMVELLEAKEGMRVLEIGGGSGYHAAVVSHLVGVSGHVYSIEHIEPLAKQAESNLAAAGVSERVTVVVGDGSAGSTMLICCIRA